MVPQVQITPEQVKNWSGYSVNRKFKSEGEAREWLFGQLERSEQGVSGDVFGRKGPEYNRQFADMFPVYQSGKTSWKIGKPIRSRRNVLRLSDIQVRRPSSEQLYNIARATVDEHYEITNDIVWVRLAEILPDSDGMYSYDDEADRIRNLAETIKSNKWIEAVVIGITNKGKWLIEGQHRARAMKLLGFGTVPAMGIVYEEPVTAWVRANCKFANS